MYIYHLHISYVYLTYTHTCVYKHIIHHLVIKHGSGKSPRNGVFHRNISYFYGPFTSKPCLMTPDGKHLIPIYRNTVLLKIHE